jgi:hypothetical protein
MTVQKFHGSIQTIKSTVKQVGPEKENMEDTKLKQEGDMEEAVQVRVNTITALVASYDCVIYPACALIMGIHSTSISWPWLMLVCIAMYNGKAAWDDLDVRFVTPG